MLPDWLPLIVKRDIWGIHLLSTMFAYALIVGIVLTILYLWKKRNLFLYSRKVKGPLALPLIGSVYKMTGLNPQENMELLLNMHEQYPDIFKLWFGPSLVYMVNKPEYLEIILKSPKSIHKNNFYNPVRYISSISVISAPVEVWKVRRKVIILSLNKMMLNSVVEIFVEKCRIFNDVIDNQLHEKRMNVFQLLTTCLLDITCGIRYAMMEMKTLISTVIRKYHIFSDFKSIEEVKLKNNLFLRLQDGPKVWMKKRS